MGKRQRKRRRETGGGEAATSTYPYGEDNSLTLRDELSARTLRTIEKLDAQPAASADDRWQRRVELLFERLVVSWEIAGLPLDGQKELLGRYRMAGSEERRWVRQTLDEHVRTHLPDLAS
jgi:hypothetical protein